MVISNYQPALAIAKQQLLQDRFVLEEFIDRNPLWESSLNLFELWILPRLSKRWRSLLKSAVWVRWRQ